MPNNRGTIHVDQRLGNFSLKYYNGALIADLISPRISVSKESDKYVIYDKRDGRTPIDDYRAQKTPAKRIDAYMLESDGQYTCEEHALFDLVSDRERQNADKPIDPDFDVTENLTNTILLNREVRTAALVGSTASYATSGHYVTRAGAEQWDHASFSPTGAYAIEKTVDTGKEAVRAAIGKEPNTIVIPAAVAKVVKRDSAVRDLIKYTQSDLLVNGDLPPTLWNMRVLIPGGVKNTAEAGQTYSGSDIWGKNVLLAYIAPNILTPRNLTLSGTFMSQNRNVKKWREGALDSDAIQVSETLVEKVICEYCGYLIASCIS